MYGSTRRPWARFPSMMVLHRSDIELTISESVR